MGSSLIPPLWKSPQWKISGNNKVFQENADLVGCGNGMKSSACGWNSKENMCGLCGNKWGLNRRMCNCRKMKSWRGSCRYKKNCNGGWGKGKSSCDSWRQNKSFANSWQEKKGSCDCKDRVEKGVCNYENSGISRDNYSSRENNVVNTESYINENNVVSRESYINENNGSCMCGDIGMKECGRDCKSVSFCEPKKTYETAYVPAPTYQVAIDECYCSYRIYLLAIVIMIFVNPIFGIVATYMAYKAKNLEQQGILNDSRRFLKFSWITSLVAIIVTSITLAILAILYFYAKVL